MAYTIEQAKEAIRFIRATTRNASVTNIMVADVLEALMRVAENRNVEVFHVDNMIFSFVGDVMLYRGEEFTITARVLPGGQDAQTALGDDFSGITWKVERDSGDPAKDALWNANTIGGAGKLVWPMTELDIDGNTVLRYDKAQIVLKWSASDADDDTNFNNSSSRASFRFTAEIPGSAAESASLTV